MPDNNGKSKIIQGHTWRYGSDVVWDDGPVGTLMVKVSMDLDPVGMIQGLQKHKMLTYETFAMFVIKGLDLLYLKYHFNCMELHLSKAQFFEAALKRVCYVLSAVPDMQPMSDQIKNHVKKLSNGN